MEIRTDRVKLGRRKQAGEQRKWTTVLWVMNEKIAGACVRRTPSMQEFLLLLLLLRLRLLVMELSLPCWTWHGKVKVFKRGCESRCS